MFLEPTDLAPFAAIAADKASAMIADAEAQATLVAPCITTLDPTVDAVKVAAVKSILRGAVLRWNDAGTGAVTQQMAGPYSQMVDTKLPRRGMFWPSEIEQLQGICATSSGAFSIDTAPGTDGLHLPWCDLYFGGTTCSCGVDIAGYPIFEMG